MTTTDPLDQSNEWSAAQSKMISDLKIGDQVAYVRLFTTYNAGVITQIDPDGTIHTDRGLLFLHNVHYGRHVLRGDPQAYLTRFFETGTRASSRFGRHHRIISTKQRKAS